MTVLVTGAAGFIGAACSRRLLERGEAVIGIDSLNDYYQVSLKHDRRDALVGGFGDRFTFLHQDFADRDGLISESADLMYHWLVVLAAAGVSLDEVAERLEAREGTSGLAEKAGR